MGTGHSIDTPLRVAHFGISSVISLVDDVLIEKVRRYYSKQHDVPFTPIAKREPLSRSRRITEYLNLVQQLVDRKMEEVKAMSFFQENDKARYFELLPDTSLLKKKYHELLHTVCPAVKETLAFELTAAMRPGSIDVNVMAKVDRQHFDKHGELLEGDISEAKSSVRGFAESALNGAVVLSAGFNRGLIVYLSQFKDFYRTSTGELHKRIILKVSDWRSALIQGKYLAMKGLEVSEYRIESGLNCGGHAFATQGLMLPKILREFQVNAHHLLDQTLPLIREFYKEHGWAYPATGHAKALVTVQGGIGTSGEADRLLKDFGCDATGWGSPFLLVPEATCVDDQTLQQLIRAEKDDLYLSDVSPLGVPFNNLRGTGSELWTRKRAEAGKSGSTCRKGYLKSNTEYSVTPICTASHLFQKQKLHEIDCLEISDDEKVRMKTAVTEKVCLCEHLGNGALINLGIVDEATSPQAVCPGPNIVWFDRQYTLREMVDHIYGRGTSLVSEERPHMFCQEVELYVDYFEKLVHTTERTPAGVKYLDGFKKNLEEGMGLCEEISHGTAYPNENLKSIPEFIRIQRERLHSIYSSEQEMSFVMA